MRRFAATVLVVTLSSLSSLSSVVRADAYPAPGTKVPADKHVQVSIDRSKVDLVGHTLEVKLSRPANRVHLKVLGDAGAVLAELDIPFHGAAAGTPLACSWTPSSADPVTRIEVLGYAPDGYWSGVAITPWSAEVPHEEVNFETDSDVIRPSESPKLDASLKAIAAVVDKHGDLGNLRLYIVGHTDTVGSADHNLELSRRRARSIAVWFKQHGHGAAAKVGLAYEGLGEAAPEVPTADEVNEPRNRRVDYVVAAEPPALPNAKLAWHSP